MTHGLGRRRAVFITALLCLTPLPVLASETCRVSFSTGAVVEAAVARTVAEQAKGLSGKTGKLLFVWADAEPRVFWMKDTPAPLDVAFIDDLGTVFDIQAMPVDAPGSSLPVYYFSGAPAKYALELPAGEFARTGIAIGDRLDALACTSQDSAD